MFICSSKQSGIILKLQEKIIAGFNTSGLVVSFINIKVLVDVVIFDQNYAMKKQNHSFEQKGKSFYPQ
jgi:hypothetical protein